MIEVRDVGYAYPGTAAPAVRELNFGVEKGEVFGLLGPSGAGKSTTQKILIGLQRDYTGAVTILGRNLRDWGSDYYEHIRCPAPRKRAVASLSGPCSTRSDGGDCPTGGAWH